jgi:ppGpp synthetase/RelA/SpoT-type nucleotidyltranferase
MALREADLRSAYEEALPRYQRANSRLKELLGDLVEDLGDRYKIRGASVTGDPKPLASFIRKVRAKEKTGEISVLDDCFAAVKDLSRARLICETLDDCQRVEKLLEEREGVYVDGTQTERYAPSKTGYRGVHLSVAVDIVIGGVGESVVCELQILTGLQHVWALLTHKDFYHGGDVPPLVGALMENLSDLLCAADREANFLIREIETVRHA